MQALRQTRGFDSQVVEKGGSNQGVTDDDVSANHQLTSRQHLVSLLSAAGLSWKAYQEDISGADCPLGYVSRYSPRHNPMVYFTDVNGGANPNAAGCIAHVRPYSELANDLEVNSVPAYSFITPNLCNDMHDRGIATGDAWLSREVPKILASRAYREGGALFITWDESAGSNVPIGFIALSPLAKAGYSSQAAFTQLDLAQPSRDRSPPARDRPAVPRQPREWHGAAGHRRAGRQKAPGRPWGPAPRALRCASGRD
jgi:phospholipase C